MYAFCTAIAPLKVRFLGTPVIATPGSEFTPLRYQPSWVGPQSIGTRGHGNEEPAGRRVLNDGLWRGGLRPEVAGPITISQALQLCRLQFGQARDCSLIALRLMGGQHAQLSI